MKSTLSILLVMALFGCHVTLKKNQTNPPLLSLLAGEWSSTCEENDGNPGKVRFDVKFENGKSYIRIYLYDEDDIKCEGDYTILVPHGSDGEDWKEQAIIIEDKVKNTPPGFFTFHDTLIGDPTDIDHSVGYFESENIFHMLYLNTRGDFPGPTWNDWLNFESTQGNVADFIASPKNYPNSFSVFRVSK